MQISSSLDRRSHHHGFWTGMNLMRFTLHSLRDRYANAALHVWKYTEEVLPQQGSWKDPVTVRRFYSGITDQTLAQAMTIHGWGADRDPTSHPKD